MMDGSSLKEWVDIARVDLENAGYSVAYKIYDHGQSSVNIDGVSSVGTITSWPGSLYEIQFNDTASGEVVALETVTLNSALELTGILRSLGIV